MKLLLATADGRIHRLKWGPVNRSFREAPLTLTTLAALVPPELHADIRVVDGSLDPIPLDEHFDLVGISLITGTSLTAYQIADHFRRRGIPVVLGGVHVSLCPDEAAQHADALVIGFAEQAWPQLLRDFAAGRMQKSYRAQTADLQGLPIARRDLQRKHGYMMPNTVFATRGCRNNCDFCTVPAVPFGWQVRPVAEVVREVAALPARRFAFNDVSITEDRDYAVQLFTALAPLKKKWGGLCTTRIIQDPELLDLMVKSGCVYLLLGFESLADSSLRGMAKGFNHTENYAAVVQALHARGIIIQGCFIFGLDDDQPSVFAETVAAVNRLHIDIPRYAIYTPYPGTPAFKRLAAEKRLLHQNWHYYDTQHVVFQPKNMTPESLDAGFVTAYAETFSLRSILQRTLKSPQFTIACVGNLAYRLYVRRLRRESPRLYAPTAGDENSRNALPVHATTMKAVT